jgi:hypothetical protein
MRERLKNLNYVNVGLDNRQQDCALPTEGIMTYRTLVGAP